MAALGPHLCVFRAFVQFVRKWNWTLLISHWTSLKQEARKDNIISPHHRPTGTGTGLLSTKILQFLLFTFYKNDVKNKMYFVLIVTFHFGNEMFTQILNTFYIKLIIVLKVYPCHNDHHHKVSCVTLIHAGIGHKVSSEK